MLFDGASTLAETSLPINDCLQDPGQCSNGFTIGTKVKFDEADMSYKEPKFIVDSGARSLNTRGVSVYIVNGNLFFELATAKKAWKVCVLNKMQKNELIIITLLFQFCNFISVIFEC